MSEGDPRPRAEALDAADAPGAERAAAWISLAEREPCFRWRAAPARAALERAIVLWPLPDRPDLDARVALRRAQLDLAEEDLAAARALADVAVVAAERAGEPTRARLARVISARAAQRDPEQAASAATELEGVAAQLAASGDEGPAGDRLLALELGAQLAIASGEQQLLALDLERAREAYDQAEGIVAEAPADALPDARFLALQGSALTAQLTRAFGRAADRLRSIVRLVGTYGAPRDELEARMGLGHVLIQLGKYDDAMRHMDLARSLANDSGTVDERLLASQSAALAALHGKSYGRALDRAYEALEVAGLEQRSLPSYIAVVSLIVQIHLARGNPSEAYLTLLYAAASVKQRLGPQATLLFDVQIEELKRGLGPAKFDAMCEEIMRARAARERLDPP